MKKLIFVPLILFLSCETSLNNTDSNLKIEDHQNVLSIKKETDSSKIDRNLLLNINKWLKDHMNLTNPGHLKWKTFVNNNGEIENLNSFFLLNQYPFKNVKYIINSTNSYFESYNEETWFFNKNKELIGSAFYGSGSGYQTTYLAEYNKNYRKNNIIEMVRLIEFTTDPNEDTYQFVSKIEDSIKSLVIRGVGEIGIDENFNASGTIEVIHEVVENNFSKSDFTDKGHSIKKQLDKQFKLLDSVCFTELIDSGNNIVLKTNIDGWIENENEGDNGGYYDHSKTFSKTLTVDKDIYESKINSVLLDTSISNNILRSIIWTGIQDFDKYLYLFHNEDYFVWVDKKNNNYRSAWWKSNQSLREKPEVFITNGKINYEGSGGNHTYMFNSGKNNYNISINVIGKTYDDVFYMNKPAQIISPFSKDVIGKLKKNDPINNKWLLIISGFDNCKNAKEAKKAIPFKTFLLHSNNYENLNPGWYLICLTFENKESSDLASKYLNSQGFQSYTKYSGKYSLN